MSNFDFIATYVDLSDSPTYTTNITLEGQLLKISFVWNERIGKRTIFIRNSADVCYLQNTILHPNESFELNSNAVFDDLPYKVVLQKVGDTNKVGNIYNWSKDFILCFYRTVDIETEKLNVKYGITTPSTPLLPPSNGGGDSGNGGGDDNGGEIPPNEVHFTTLAGIIDYIGEAGDQILLSDGTIVDVTVTYDTFTFNVPSGKHIVKLVESVDRIDYVKIGGEALVELHNFPTLSSVNAFAAYSSPNLVKAPTVLPSNITNLSWMFQEATSFNQDISMWDTSNVKVMGRMFELASAFNQDLSGWCVSNITSPPYEFDFGATSWTLPRPVWGTCPL